MAKKGFMERERSTQPLRGVHRSVSTTKRTIHAVKNSLSQVLSSYYPLAGKWIVTEDAWARKLVCNDEGALFVEAAVDYEMDNVLHSNDFNPSEELTGDHAVPGFEAASLYRTSETKESPALIVQVTRFKCGGVALTLNFNHTTVDGFGFNRFLKAWSEIISTGQTSAKPVFDRSMVVSHLDKSHILGIQPDMENRDDVISSYFQLLRPEGQRNESLALFSIRKDAVERLRQKAKEEHVSDVLQRPERFTTFECVCTQLWRCFARIPKVLGLMSGEGGEDMVRITFPVEGRRKWSNPPLPEDYVGNMLLGAASPVLPGPEVTDKPFSVIASLIHESTEKTLETEKPCNHNRIFEVLVTSWSRFDNFYNLDFGCGSPFFFSPFTFATAKGGVVVCLLPPPPKSGDAVELLLRRPLDCINILREDPEFIHLVS